jgi:hypothetical protein
MANEEANMATTRVRKLSRFALGGVRLVNGAAALGAPGVVARQLGADGERGVHYALQLFGIRTVILGAELLFLRGPRLEWAVRVAPIIHASDTVSAAVAGIRKQILPRAAVLAVFISAMNTVLALLAQEPRKAKQLSERHCGRDTTRQAKLAREKAVVT